jgi:hypothetical protein
VAASPDADAQKNCSPTSPPGKTTQNCPLKKIIDIAWDKVETWCSEGGPIHGTTQKYSDGEAIAIDVEDHADGTSVLPLPAKVAGNAFKTPWDVIDVLPTGGPSWKDRRELDGVADGVKTPTAMAVRFIPNVKRGKKTHTTQYDRKDPKTGVVGKTGVVCRFELESVNYLLTIHGQLDYVRGRGRERLLLNDASLQGSFTVGTQVSHWGQLDPVSTQFKYWDGKGWQDPPKSWEADNSNHFGIGFYKSGSSWVCRDAPSQSWPGDPIADWPATKFTGAGNMTDTTLATWKKNIDAAWTDKFDLKRKECKSTKSECCRYKTLCVAKFAEVNAYAPGETIIVVYEDIRSDSGMWAMGDTRAGLAPHEFGHLLGAPDEYGGVGTTQLGVNDSDGLSDGIDDASMMGTGLSNVKKRHYKGICEVFALLVADEVGKTYTYEAVATGTSLASPPGSSVSHTTHPSGGSGGSSSLVGAIVGGIIGAVVGAIIGFIASGGSLAGAAIGAAAGALIGAGLGSLF